jgi:plasmid stabilization system protein ParE
MAAIRFAPLARDDLLRVRVWYTQPGSGQRAKARVQRILRAIRELTESPQRWPLGDLPGTRERVVERHVIVYRTLRSRGGNEDTIVEIIRIFGPGQNRQIDTESL